MEVKFTLKNGEIESNKAVYNEKTGETTLEPIKVKQNDVLLEDGKNTYLLPIGQAEVKCEELEIGEDKIKHIVVYQDRQILKKYRWDKNTFKPTAKTPEDLAAMLSLSDYLNTNI